VAWLILLGIVALVGGAELLVTYGTNLAHRLHISPIVIGLTVVSFGTSAPELAVAIDSLRRGAGSLALGNIVGTNIVNILLILGLAAAIRPILMGDRTLRFDLPVMVGTAIILAVFAANGVLSRIEGFILFALAIAYLLEVARTARKEHHERPEIETESDDDEETPDPGLVASPLLLLRDLFLLIIGIVIVIQGANWLVDGAVQIAEHFGISETIIGLTIVAVGTSLPELATTLSATIRGRRAIAVGTLIGSSTLNVTLVLGLALILGPGLVPVERGIALVELPLMVLASAICIPIFLTGKRIRRKEGALMVALYGLYLAYQLWSANR